MQLELDEGDLLEQYRMLATSKVGFAHLNKKAQRAVQAVGHAVFFRGRGGVKEHNAIIPPSKIRWKKLKKP